MTILPATPMPDSGTYEQMASRLASHHDLRDPSGNRARVMPGYPVFVLAAHKLLGSSVWSYRVPQAVLGVGTAAGVTVLGTSLWGWRAGALAGGLAAIDPFLVYFESLELSEGLAVFLLVWTAVCAWFARRRRAAAIAAGVLAGLATLVRPAMLPLSLSLIVGAEFVPLRDGARCRTTVINGVLAVGLLMCILAPWWVRNERVLHAFVPLTTDGGATAYEGSSPEATGGPASVETSQARAAELGFLGEVQRDRVLSREAHAWMRSHVSRWERLALVKLSRTWNPKMNFSGYQAWYYTVISVAAWLAVMGLAALGVLAGWRTKGAILYCLAPVVLVSMGVVMVIGSVRYRVPAWPFLEVLAGLGLLVCLEWMRGRARRSSVRRARSWVRPRA